MVNLPKRELSCSKPRNKHNGPSDFNPVDFFWLSYGVSWRCGSLLSVWLGKSEERLHEEKGPFASQAC